MSKSRSLYHIFLILCALAGAIWSGSYIARFSTFYFIFDGPELQMKSYLVNDMLRGLLYGLVPSLSMSLFSYLGFILFFYLTVFSSGLSLKKEGWLFISLILVTLTAPFELYLIWKFDYKLFSDLYYTTFNPEGSVQFYVERIKTFSFMPVVSLLNLAAIFILFYFRPFRMVKKDNEA